MALGFRRDTREQLLHSAQEVFLRDGISQATIESISRYAGLTRGAFYYYFKNKDEVINTLLEMCSLPFQKYISTYENHKNTSPPIEAIRMACRAGLEELDLEHNRRVHRIILLNGIYCEGADFSTYYPNVLEELRSALLDGFQRAADKAELSPTISPENAACIMQNLLTGFYRNWLINTPDRPLKKEGMHMVKTMLFLMRTPNAYPTPVLHTHSLKEEQS